MKSSQEKILMSEIAVLYYEQNKTQQEIAELMNLSRQTVSKLLNDAIKENIVEIRIHNPKKDCKELQEKICNKFGIEKCVVCAVKSKNQEVRRLMTVKAAQEYLIPKISKGNLKIAVSMGRTVQSFIDSLPEIKAKGNIVFPLLGATDNENLYFSSNELARSLADKIGAGVKFAWFPYLADSTEDSELLKKASYYKKIQSLWNEADLSIVGVGNREILDVFGNAFGFSREHSKVIGDIATHFFTENGEFINLYENALCASLGNMKNSKQTVAIACGSDKKEAIVGALKTKILDTLVTDEYTAREILENI